MSATQTAAAPNAERETQGAECGMRNAELTTATKRFALDVIRLVGELPRSRTAEVVGRQLLRSATSVGANYRAACRAKSRADFISKMETVEEEGDECSYWMELLVDAEIGDERRIQELLAQSSRIVAMTVSSIKTARRNA